MRKSLIEYIEFFQRAFDARYQGKIIWMVYMGGSFSLHKGRYWSVRLDKNGGDVRGPDRNTRSCDLVDAQMPPEERCRFLSGILLGWQILCIRIQITL